MPGKKYRGVRGIRTGLVPGTVIGRAAGSGRRGATGAAQQITLPQLAGALSSAGLIPASSGASLITSVDGNFVVSGGVLEFNTIASGDLLGNSGAGTAEPTATTLTALIDRALGSTEGQILQRGVSAWQVLAPGTAGQVLTSGGASALNAWATGGGGSGLITSVDGNFTVTGGGQLEFATIASGDLIANSGSSTAEPTATTLTALIDRALGSTEGDILQRGASAWQVLTPGTAGQVLTSGGASALNSWAASTVAFTNSGAWSGTASYTPGDVVQYEGSAYLCYLGVSAPAGGTAAEWTDFTGMTLSTTVTTDDTATSQAVSNGNAISALNGVTSGDYYFEAEGTNLIDTGTQFGLTISTGAITGGVVYFEKNGAIGSTFAGGGSAFISGGWVAGKRSAMAFQANGQFWFCPDVTQIGIGSTGYWNGSSTANPATNTGGVAMGTLGAAMLCNFYTQSSAAQVCQLFTTNAEFLIASIPSGFTEMAAPAAPNVPPTQDDAHWLSVGYISSTDTNFTVTTSGELELNNPVTATVPTFQILTTGTTYTPTSAAVKWIEVEFCGGGGGASGATSSTGATPVGTAGGTTTFNSITAIGGSPGTIATSGIGGAGGTGGSGTSGVVKRAPGNSGGGSAYRDSTAANAGGAAGGGSAFFGGGGYGAGGGNSGNVTVNGGSAPANSGGGGGGAFDSSTTYFTVSASGGGGESVKLILPYASSYSYSIGAGGAGGIGTATGGAGAAGKVIVTEHYNY